MKKNQIGKADSSIPGEKSNRPLSTSQSAGSTNYDRMTTGAKSSPTGGQKPTGMPTVHQ